MSKYDSLYERLVANSVELPNGCWQWTGNKDAKGYGRLTMRMPGKRNPQAVRAHRVMVEILRRQEAQRRLDDLMPGLELWPEDDFDVVPLDSDEETIEHECLNTSCINPDHMALLTRAQNTAAMNARRLYG